MELLHHFFSKSFLTHFTALNTLEYCEIDTKQTILEIHLEENNNLPLTYDNNLYESKGFYPAKKIQDFPVRGKPVYLVIKRRRWRLKEDKSVIIKSDYSFVAEGSKITKELSDFLKCSNR